MSDRSVLLVQRRHEPHAGTWIFPAGFVSFGEHPHQAVLREVTEETGLRAEVSALIDMFISDDDPREPNHLAMFFALVHPVGDLSNDGAEYLAIGWFPLDRLPDIQLRHHLAIAHRLRDDVTSA